MSKPWPIPFPLPPPESFGPCLVDGLTKGCLKPGQESKLLKTLYDVITQFTFYPSPLNFRSIGTALMHKYPAMKAGMDDNEALSYWSAKLSNKMRNVRKYADKDIPVVKATRERRNIATTNSSECEGRNTGVKKMKLHGVLNYLPDRPLSEDDNSIENYKKKMVTESKKKKNVDSRLIENAMNATFSDRRKYIIQLTPTIMEIKMEYPCLFMFHQVLYEFHRLTEIPLQERLTEYLNKYSDAIIKCKIEDLRKSNDNPELLEELENVLPEEANVFALNSIPSLLRDTETSFTTQLAENDKFPVLVKAIDDNEGSLHIEHGEICTYNSMTEGVAALFASHYVFNLVYRPKLKKSLLFIQKKILNIADRIKTPLIITDINKRINSYEQEQPIVE